MYTGNPTICLRICDTSGKNLSNSSSALEFLQDVTGVEILDFFGHNRDDWQLCAENGKDLNLDDSLFSQGVRDEDILQSNNLDETNTVVKRALKITQKSVILNDKDRNSEVSYVLDESKTIRDYVSDYWIVMF